MSKLVIRAGDIWQFTTNDGVIDREITLVGIKKIAYINMASGEENVCLINTFRKWARGAELVFALDWTDR